MAKAPKPDGERGVFIDRDGVINEYRSDYVRVREDFAYYEFTEKAFRVLGLIGLPLVVVTNQSGIGRGYTTQDEVEYLNEKLRRDAAAWDAPLGAIEYCPHTPDENCQCRKPAPAMFERASRKLRIQCEGSYMIGDAPSDIQAGRSLGMTTIRVRTGRGAEAARVTEDWQVDDFLAAATKVAQLEGFLE
ncbi:MAG: HAD family hydrolase [Planctomycetota bacterium]